MSWLLEAFLEEEREREMNVVCYFCEKKGHYKVDCPKRKAQLKCWRCGEYGHTRDVCTIPYCRKCHAYGHVCNRNK